MELYAGVMGGRQGHPPVGFIKAAWCNNVGRYFNALVKTYGPCVEYHTEATSDGESVVTGWVFENDRGKRCTVRLFTPCPITDPEAVSFGGHRYPFKNFVLKQRRVVQRPASYGRRILFRRRAA
jgi:hypothetical protein